MGSRAANLFLLLLGLALVVWSFVVVLGKPAPAKYQSESAGPTITVDGRTIQVEVADTEALREQGLSDRASLPAGRGMLFVFDEPGDYGFWMRNMRFPLDIVWLEREGEGYRAVDITRNVLPDTFPQVFYPPRPVKYVLETNPGEL